MKRKTRAFEAIAKLGAIALVAIIPSFAGAADKKLPDDAIFGNGTAWPGPIRWSDGSEDPTTFPSPTQELASPEACSHLAGRIDAEVGSLLSGLRATLAGAPSERSIPDRLILLRLSAMQEIAMHARLCGRTDYDLRLLALAERMSMDRVKLGLLERARRACAAMSPTSRECSVATAIGPTFSIPRFSLVAGRGAARAAADTQKPTRNEQPFVVDGPERADEQGKISESMPPRR
jgi:hypothetical protein